MQDQINYSELIDGAMRGVVRDVLRFVEKNGLPGTHHFYISFRTDAPGVRVSDALRARYPQEMTIVLQHQFWDFQVEEEQFQVTLSFGGVPEKLLIAFSALTAFADPSIKFGLQFQNVAAEDEPGGGSPMPPLPKDSAQDENPAQAAEIFSLDAFRKK